MPSPTDTNRPLVDLARIPHPLLRLVYPVFGPLLNRFLKIAEINHIHAETARLATPETFFETVLETVGCRYEVSEADLQRIPEKGPVVVVANHPLGGLDGIVLGHLLRRRRTDTRLMANFLLKNVHLADHHMIFVDPFAKSAPATSNIAPLRESLKHLKGGGLLGVFPGNQVSHFRKDQGEVTDADWVPHIAALIRRTGATVVSVFIDAQNSAFFNRAGMLHPLLRTLLLTREFVNRGKSEEPIRVTVGTPIASARLTRFAKDEEMIRFLRMSTYMLKNRPKGQAARPLSQTAPLPLVPSQPVAKPLSPHLLEADLHALPNEARLLGQSGCDVFIATYDQLPHVIQEIGRGRELSFRYAGGGTGMSLDLSEADQYYRHLFVWNRKDRAVVGAYRVGLSDEILAERGPEGLVSNGLFEFKPSFLERLNPGLELGRSYVLPEYQRSYSSLLLLWGGIFAFVAKNPRYRMTFGSVGISQGDEYCQASRTLIVDYMRRQHGMPELALELQPRSPFDGMQFGPVVKEDVSRLVRDVDDVSALVSGLEQDGKGVPILVKHYMRMNARLLDFGVWKSHGNAVVAFVLGDLTTADSKMLRRYMGDEAYQRFMELHGVPIKQTSPQSEKSDSAQETAAA